MRHISSARSSNDLLIDIQQIAARKLQTCCGLNNKKKTINDKQMIQYYTYINCSITF